MTQLIILALLAALSAWALYTVLGRRTGHEQRFAPIAEDAKATNTPTVATLADRPQSASITPPDAKVLAGLKSITSADNNFSTPYFMEGARAAYEDILTAYWKEDEAELARHVSPEVQESFNEAIAARKAKGLALDNRLVTVEKIEILKAWIENKVANIQVVITADIATVTRDAQGTVVAGSLSDAVQSNDVWTFARPIRATSPDWILVETDESSETQRHVQPEAA